MTALVQVFMAVVECERVDSIQGVEIKLRLLAGSSPSPVSDAAFACSL